METYEFTWPGKRASLKEALSSCSKQLVFEEDNASENMFITGDNIDALKLLQATHASKVKMIYIDPPYNTSKKFNYNDNFNYSKKEWLKLYPDSSLYGRFHSKWLSMMYPRLYVARNLLREDGVIFISIDDHEVANLRKLCDEVFGEENFLESFIWIKKTAPNNVIIGSVHEYILIYAKNLASVNFYLLPRDEHRDEAYSNPDNDPRGLWKPDNITSPAKGGRSTPSLVYELVNPYTNEKYLPPKGRMWSITKKEMEEKIKNNSIYWGKDNRGRPMNKRFLSETRKGMVASTLLDDDGTNSSASKELYKIFNEEVVFETPKPVKLLLKLLNLSCKNSDMVLDFFAGSATTAHAVLDLNKQDGGDRKFILVQLPEPCAPESEAAKAGYKTIADIGKERIRRVIKRDNLDVSFNSYVIK